ncbi:DUF2163 domain-containing protein [Ralstonia sp. 25C]|uniref:DUF2163 domain-containing protein n=1 Tax=Ralstonia sp. 25C TaxID=3447363 RepID=UPI003F75042D
MRNISTALAAHLAGDTLTVCTLWLITRKDGQQFGFTDLDRDVTFNGFTYKTAGGYTHSQIDNKSDLSVTNMEVTALFDSSAIQQVDIEAGLWDNAAVTISLINYADLTQGAAILQAGSLGQVTLLNGQYKAEFRGLAQMMQQTAGEPFSPTCRASLGDSRCTIALGPLTATGTVTGVTNTFTWLDTSLTQTGPTVAYTDTRGHKIPTTGPYTIKVVPPTGGAFVADGGVTDSTGNVWTQVVSGPGAQQYSVASDGTYTFDGSDNPGWEVFISYTYSIGYFAYGTVTFLTGANAGYSTEVKSFAPGVVTVALPFPFPVSAGDTYTIVAGCDRTFGTCKTRFNNVVNFRGEPYVPGADTTLRPQST